MISLIFAISSFYIFIFSAPPPPQPDATFSALPFPKDLIIAQQARKASLLYMEESFGTPLRPFLGLDHATLEVIFLFAVLYIL